MISRLKALAEAFQIIHIRGSRQSHISWKVVVIIKIVTVVGESWVLEICNSWKLGEVNLHTLQVHQVANLTVKKRHYTLRSHQAWPQNSEKCRASDMGCTTTRKFKRQASLFGRTSQKHQDGWACTRCTDQGDCWGVFWSQGGHEDMCSSPLSRHHTSAWSENPASYSPRVQQFHAYYIRNTTHRKSQGRTPWEHVLLTRWSRSRVGEQEQKGGPLPTTVWGSTRWAASSQHGAIYLNVSRRIK